MNFLKDFCCYMVIMNFKIVLVLCIFALQQASCNCEKKTMGEVTKCDNAKDELGVDLKDKEDSTKCNGEMYPKNKVVNLISRYDRIKSYSAKHICMDKDIQYKDDIPTLGDHRENWAVFGEYNYLPPQRWLHNAEHGAVILLFHPCADNKLVNDLKAIVKDCLKTYGKYIITPTNKLSADRPVALVAWGCKLEINEINEAECISLIKECPSNAPEFKYFANGRYNKGLKVSSDPNEPKLPKGKHLSKDDSQKHLCQSQ